MTTYYVDGAVGSDANAGTSEGSGNAWLTIDKAMNTAQTAGDIVYVKATGTYDENGNIDVAGTIAAPIEYHGYTTTPGDEGKVTWTNSSGSALTDSTTTAYYAFFNFDINGCSSSGAALAGGLKFMNCDFTSNSGFGLSAGAAVLYNCTAFSNSSNGIQISGNNLIIAGCISALNTGKGFVAAGAEHLIYKCVAYGQTNDALDILADRSYVIGCTFDGEDTTARLIDSSGEHLLAIIDCILYDGVTAYYTTDTGVAAHFYFMGANNLINSVTNSYHDGSSEFTTPGIGYQDVTSAPAFTDEAGDDYTLGSSSPAIDAGIQPGGIT